MAAILTCAGLSALLGALGFSGQLEDAGSLRGLYAVVLALAAAQVLGALAISLGRTRLGATVVFVTALPLVPLGLVGAWGARCVMDDAAAAQFRCTWRSRV